MRSLDRKKWAEILLSDDEAERYSRAVCPDKIQSHKNSVVDQVENIEPEYVSHVCALTEFVYNTVSWGNPSPDLYECDVILDHDLRCDCEDQTTLLLSLLAAADIDELGVMSVDLRTSDAAHLMGLVGFGPAEELNHREIETAIEQYFDTSYVGFGWFRWDSTAWLVVDPVNTPVPGQPSEDYQFGRVIPHGLSLRPDAHYCLSRVSESQSVLANRSPEGIDGH